MKIKKEFKNFLGMTSQQREALEAQILQDGRIIQPLVVGKYTEDGVTHEYLVDGYARLEIAEKHQLPYEVVIVHFESEEDVYT